MSCQHKIRVCVCVVCVYMQDRDVEVKKAVSQDDIRKQGGMGADRSGGGGGGGGGKSRGYSDQGLGGRGALADPYGGARYKAGYPMDYRMSSE